MSLNLALVVSGNATGAKDATQQTKGAIGSLRAEAVSASTAMAAANDQVVASARRAAEAATAQEAAQRRLQTSIQSMLSAAQPTGEAAYQKRAADIAAYGAALDRLKARYDPLFAAQQKYQAAIEAINQAERTGAISASLAIDARLRETAALNGQISALNGVAAAQKNAAQAMVNRVAIVPDRGADIEAYGQQLDALRARFNPIYAAIAQYKTAVMEAREAERLGAISSDEMTAAIGRQRQATLASIAAIKSRQTAANTNNPRLSGPQLQGLGYQANDVVTMAMMGAPLSQIAASQGGQILQTLQMGEGGVSGSLSAIKGSIAAAATATAGFLGTVGMIATGFGVAAVAAGAFYFATREKAKDLKDALEEERQAILDVANAYDLAKVKADTYNKSSGIFAAAAARKGQSDLSGAAHTEDLNVLDSLARFVVPGYHQAGHYEARSQFSAFDDPIRAYAKSVGAGAPDYDALAKGVHDIVVQNPALQVTGDKILNIAKAGAEASGTLKEAADTLARISSRAPSQADSELARQYREQSDVTLTWLDRQRAASLQSIVARSPEEHRQAAIAGQAAQNNDDSAEVRDFKEQTAGAIAYAQAIRAITEAQEQRLRSYDQAIASAQLDVAMVGKSTAETQALRFEHERLAQVREEAARNGIKSEAEFQRVFGEEVASIHAKAVEYGKLMALQEARSTIRGQQDDLEQQRLELSLVGAGTLARQRAIASLKTEQEIRKLGIPLYGAEAEAMRANTAAMSDLAEQSAKAGLQQQLLFERQQMFRSEIEQTVASTMKNAGLDYDPNSMIAQQIRYNEQLKTTKAAWEDIFSSVNDGIDSISDALFSGGSIEDALKKAGSQLAKTIFDMAATNPIENWLTGANKNTIGDLGIFPGAWSGKGGGFGGALGQMLGAQKAVASMQVQAASVFINGSPLGVPGLPGVPGVPGATNDNGGIFGWFKSLFGGSSSPSTFKPDTTLSDILGYGGSAVDTMTTGSVLRGGSSVDLASKLLGLNEISNTGAINSFLKAGGVDLNAASQAWCAAFVNSSLKQVGINGSGSNVASSFLNWGQGINPANLLKGDVLVEGRGLLAGQLGGHVGLATGLTRMTDQGMQMQMLSGNLSNKVGLSWVDAAETSIRRASDALGGVANTAMGATQGLGRLGSGLGQLGSMLNQFPAAPAGGGGGGGLFGWLGSLFGGGGLFGPGVTQATMCAISPMATANILSGSWGLFANGAAFRNGNVVPFAKGDVFSSPTYFPMSAGRTGVLGEDGEEAIMPLRRGPDGRLGVVNHNPLRAPRVANGNAAGGGSGGGLTREHIRGIVSEIGDKLRLQANIINLQDGSDIKRWLTSEDGRATIALINRQAA